MTLTFYWPWLSLLVLLPLLAWWWLPVSKRVNTHATPEILFPRFAQLKAAFAPLRVSGKRSRKGFLTLLWLIWILLVAAVMRPQFVDQYAYIKNQGYDLMLAVDISKSMRALDFSTKDKTISRLDVTKDVVSAFAQARQGDRVGLILFGEHAYLQVPLTLDTISVSHMLQNAVSGMAGNATAIGDAIGLAVRNLREREEGSRVIVLLTDGKDTASTIPPVQAAKLAKQYGIRIYTIAVGKNGRVPYPDDVHGVVMAELPIDEVLLQDIATQTDGAFFRAADADTLKKIYQTIDALEKTEAETRAYKIRQPLYRYPLGVASGLFLILCCMPLLRRVGRHV